MSTANKQIPCGFGIAWTRSQAGSPTAARIPRSTSRAAFFPARWVPRLVLGLGGLYGAIEWFGKIDAQLRALLNVQVATLYGVPY